MKMFPKQERIEEGHISVYVKQVMHDIYARMDLPKVMAEGGSIADAIRAEYGAAWRDIKPHPMGWVYRLPRETFPQRTTCRFKPSRTA